MLFMSCEGSSFYVSAQILPVQEALGTQEAVQVALVTQEAR